MCVCVPSLGFCSFPHVPCTFFKYLALVIFILLLCYGIVFPTFRKVTNLKKYGERYEQIVKKYRVDINLQLNLGIQEIFFIFFKPSCVEK